MTTREMHNAFEIELGRMDSNLLVESFKILYWLNEAITQFVKTRYTGNNYLRRSFEEIQKRTDDLRTLVTTSTIDTFSTSGNKYTATLPDDYLILINDRALITSTSDDSVPDAGLEIGVITVTENDLNAHLADPFSPHNLTLGKANPLRLFTENGIVLYTDGNYTIDEYYLTYIKTPSEIDYSTDCDLPVHTHNEIVKLAVKLCLENLRDSRLPTYKQEVNETIE